MPNYYIGLHIYVRVAILSSGRQDWRHKTFPDNNVNIPDDSSFLPVFQFGKLDHPVLRYSQKCDSSCREQYIFIQPLIFSFVFLNVDYNGKFALQPCMLPRGPRGWAAPEYRWFQMIININFAGFCLHNITFWSRKWRHKCGRLIYIFCSKDTSYIYRMFLKV